MEIAHDPTQDLAFFSPNSDTRERPTRGKPEGHNLRESHQYSALLQHERKEKEEEMVVGTHRATEMRK